MTPRLIAALALAVLAAGLVAVIALTTPWQPLPGTPPGGRVAVSVPRDFTAAQIAREQAFHARSHPPAWAGYALGIAVAGILGLTGAGARLVTAAARPLGGGWVWQVLLGTVAVTAVARLAVLPLDAAAEAALRRYGLSVQSWGGWLLDVGKGYGLATGLLLLVLLPLVALARWLPRWWFAPAALAGAALVVVVSFAYPLVVEPVFNQFRPLDPGPLRTSLLDLARRDGVPVTDVLVADASRRTTTLNAYVSGFAGTRRIVVYDTLLRADDPEQVRLVVAHELGHAKRDDVLHGTVEGALGVAAGACLLFLLLGWTPLLRRAGAAGAGDPRAIALVLFLVTALTALTGPLQNLVSRRIEARADVHSLDLTRDPAVFASSQRELAVRNLSSLRPAPLVYGLFASHPTAPERIALARTWALLHGVEPPPPLAPGGR